MKHKSVNTLPSRWRPWHPCHTFHTALPTTTVYSEPGAYDVPFVGWRGVNRRMPHRGVNRLMPHPVLKLGPSSVQQIDCTVFNPTDCTCNCE